MTTPGDDDDLLGSTNPDEVVLGIEGGPFDLAAAVETPGYKAIMSRHLFGSVRTPAGITLREANDQSDHPTASDGSGRVVWGGFDDLTVGSLVDQIRAMGFDVDARWLIEAAAHHLPTVRTLPHPDHDDGDAGLAELRRNGDSRVTEETKAAVRALTQADWDQHADVVDELTKHDFDDADADI